MTTNKGKRTRRTRSPGDKRVKPGAEKRGTLSSVPESPVLSRFRDAYYEQMEANAPTGPGVEIEESLTRFPFEQELDLNKIPEAAWDALLDDICETGNITKSCQRIGVKRVTLYKKAQRDEAFGKRLEEAHATGLRHLEDVAVKRATEGVSKPVFFMGEVVGFTQEYSDQLLQFLLQGNHPKYKRGGGEQGDAALGGGILVVPAPLPATDWETAAKEMQKALREGVRE